MTSLIEEQMDFGKPITQARGVSVVGDQGYCGHAVEFLRSHVGRDSRTDGPMAPAAIRPAPRDLRDRLDLDVRGSRCSGPQTCTGALELRHAIGECPCLACPICAA